MPIDVVCPNCQEVLTLPEDSAGKSEKCPKCKAPITIPDPLLPPPDPIRVIIGIIYILIIAVGVVVVRLMLGN